MFATFFDAIEHVMDYLGSTGSENVLRDARRAVLEAYQDLTSSHNWTYLYRHGRIYTQPPFDGSALGATLAILVASGAYPNQVTLTNGVWPANAAGCYLKIGIPAYRVAQRISDTVLVLDPSLAPENDVPSTPDFKLFQDTYLLPIDFQAQDQALYEQNFGGMRFIHPRYWLFQNRYTWAEGVPAFFSITGDPQYPGRLVMRIVPWPAEQRSIDFVYKRMPRPLAIVEQSLPGCTATVSTNVINSPAGFFSDNMVGSVIRLSWNNSARPTSIVGDNPAAFESIITMIDSSTQVQVADTIHSGFPANMALVTDPIDIEQYAMLNAFWRCCEMHISFNRVLKDKPSARLQYEQQLRQAKAVDSRTFSGRVAGQHGRYRQRLRDMPTTYDEP